MWRTDMLKPPCPCPLAPEVATLRTCIPLYAEWLYPHRNQALSSTPGLATASPGGAAPGLLSDESVQMVRQHCSEPC